MEGNEPNSPPADEPILMGRERRTSGRITKAGLEKVFVFMGGIYRVGTDIGVPITNGVCGTSIGSSTVSASSSHSSWPSGQM